MAATVSMRVNTGTNAGTESGAVTSFALMDIDSATDDPDGNQVAPGSNSFEKIIRLKVDDADGQSLSSFWVERTGDLPDGVVVKIGVSDTGTTPTASESAVARETMAAGRRYWFDSGTYDADGDRMRFVYLQEQVSADAATGAIDTQAFEFGWSTS